MPHLQMISVIDFDGYSLFGGDTRFNKALGKSSEMSALYYPQVRSGKEFEHVLRYSRKLAIIDSNQNTAPCLAQSLSTTPCLVICEI